MTIYPSGGKEQTKAPSERQMGYLEGLTGLDLTDVRCTAGQASCWIYWWKLGKSLLVEAELLQRGAKETW